MSRRSRVEDIPRIPVPIGRGQRAHEEPPPVRRSQRTRRRLDGEARNRSLGVFSQRESARSAFTERAAKLGFLLRSTSEPEKPGDRFGARLFRIDAPAFDAIDDVTLPLFELATALGGDYDGWETMVLT